MARVNAILDHAIHTTMDRIDDTADRMRSNVRAKTSAVVGFVRGLRVAIEVMRHSRHQAHENVHQHEHVNEEETIWQTDTIDSTTTKAAAAVL